MTRARDLTHSRPPTQVSALYAYVAASAMVVSFYGGELC